MLDDKLTELEYKLNEIMAKLDSMNAKINRIDAHTIIIGCNVGVKKLCKTPED
jgi:hypothetical protein